MCSNCSNCKVKAYDVSNIKEISNCYPNTEFFECDIMNTSLNYNYDLMIVGAPKYLNKAFLSNLLKEGPIVGDIIMRIGSCYDLNYKNDILNLIKNHNKTFNIYYETIILLGKENEIWWKRFSNTKKGFKE